MQLRPRSVALSCWPSERQTLLLGTAAWEGQRALDAWNRWRRTVALEEVTDAELPLLAAVYRPLRGLGVDDPMLARARGVYRKTWYLNNLMLRRAATVVAALKSAGIEVLVLKGVALTFLYKLDVGSRPIGDIDLLVTPDRLDDAIEALRGQGWRPLASQTRYLGPLRYGTHLQDAELNQIDLHRYSLMQSVDDSDLWETRVPLELINTHTFALAPAEQLLHVCAHGMRWEGPNIRWPADAMSVLRATRGELDWERLVERAQARRLTVMLAEALTWLRHVLDAEIPGWVLERLRATRPLGLERTVYKVSMRPPTNLAYALLSFDRYRRFATLAPPHERPSSFAAYLRRSWQLERSSELLIHASRKVASRARCDRR